MKNKKLIEVIKKKKNRKKKNGITNKLGKKKKINLKRVRKISVFFKAFIPVFVVLVILSIILIQVSYTEQRNNIKNELISTARMLVHTAKGQTDSKSIAGIRTDMDVIKKEYVVMADLFTKLKQDDSLKCMYTIYFEEDKMFIGVDGESEGGNRSFPGTEIERLYPNRPDIDVLSRGEDSYDEDIVYNSDGEAIISAYVPVLDEDGTLVGAIVCDYDAQSLIDELDALLKKFITIAIVCVVVASIIIAIIILLVIKNMNNINNKIYNLASNEGDLSKEVTIKSRDELYVFAKHLNALIGYIKAIVINIRDNSIDIGKIVRIAAEDVNNSKINIQDANGRIHNIEVAVSDINNKIHIIDTDTKEIIDTVNRTNESVDNAVRYVDAIMHRADKTRSDAVLRKNKVNTSIVTLSESMLAKIEATKNVTVIRELADTIISITDETNLLALNASVKAAQAGAEGKGFVVVAEEIGNLALNTEQAALEIQEESEVIIAIVNELMEEIKEVLSFINTSTEKVFYELVEDSDIFYEGSEQLSGILRMFSDSVEKLTVKLSGIGKAIGNINDTVSGSNDKMGTISKLAENLSHGIEDVGDSIVTVEEIGKELDNEVSRFKL